MRKNILRTLIPIALIFTLISCTAEGPEETDVASNPKEVKTYAYQADETILADLINEYRASKNLRSLAIVNHISYKSEEHNEYMISRHVVNHDLFPERSENIIEVLGAVKVNENIAYNFTTPNSALHAWLKSPAHKANIEGDFTHFGISISTDTVTGEKYYTNIFIKK